MKHQTLFSSKHKSKKLRCRLLQFLFGALEFRMYHNFTSLFSKLRKRTFYKEISKFQKKYRVISI